MIVQSQTSGEQFVFLGDSVTVGTGASTPSLRWTSLLCVNYSKGESNLGAGGRTASQTSDAPYDYSVIPTKRISDKFLFITFGLNDSWRPGCTAQTFEDGMMLIINAALAKGWSYSSIVLTSDCFTDGGGAGGVYSHSYYDANMRAKLALISTTYNIQFIDWFTYGVANFNPAWFSALPDGVHPTDLGYLAKKNYIVANLVL